MPDSCQSNRGAAAGEGATTRRTVLHAPENLHTLALCTEHASARSLVQTQAAFRASSMLIDPQRDAERAGSASDEPGRPEIVLHNSRLAL